MWTFPVSSLLLWVFLHYLNPLEEFRLRSLGNTQVLLFPNLDYAVVHWKTSKHSQLECDIHTHCMVYGMEIFNPCGGQYLFTQQHLESTKRQAFSLICNDKTFHQAAESLHHVGAQNKAKRMLSMPPLIYGGLSRSGQLLKVSVKE